MRSQIMNTQLYCDIWKYSDSGRADWLNEFVWQKIQDEPLKYIRFTPPEAIPQ